MPPSLVSPVTDDTPTVTPAEPEPSKPDGARQKTPPAPHRLAIFSVVAMALLMSSLDGTIVATALKSIQRGLHSSINWASWVITAYAVGMALALSLAGKLTELFGRRKYFLISVAVFALSSLCCGFVNNIYLLIAFRVVQAAGGAGFTPSATGIIVEHFGDARDRAVGLFGSIFSIGSIAGPVFGGLFVTYWSWRGIFFVNVPIGVLLTVLCLKYVPSDPERAPGRRSLDLPGLGLLAVGFLGFMTATTYLGSASAHWWAPQFIAPALIAIAGLAQFMRHVRRVTEPFISPHFITGEGFAAVNAVNILYGGAASGMMTLVPLYAVDRYAISPLGSGTILTAQSVAVIAIASVAVIALRRTGYRMPLYIGSLFIIAGILLLALHPLGVSTYVWLTCASLLVGVGAGLSDPASRNAGLQLAPGKAPALAAMRSTGRQIGQIAAVSITASILARSHHPGTVQAKVYFVFALVLVVCLPVIRRITEHRGSW
jgi:EmrB/QacA subfamily drug resistance transporter